jgi:Protein of unknown function (DUF3168)
MTVALSIPLQTDVYQAVSAAVAPLQVFDHAPKDPPLRFIRLDGFTVDDLRRKNGEVARHSFEVHVFDRPVGGGTSIGQKWIKQTIAQAHAAIMAATLAGSQAQFEYSTVDPDKDGVSMHGRARYTIVL